MRTPVGSSKISARSFEQKSPVFAPTGVTLTVCACAREPNARSVTSIIAICHLRLVIGFLLIASWNRYTQRRWSACSDEKCPGDLHVETQRGSTSRIGTHHAETWLR